MYVEESGLERWLSRADAVAHDLATGTVVPVTLGELLNESELEAFLGESLGYGDGRGSEPLREAVAALYPEALPDNVHITTGSSEALFLTCWRLIDAGDEMVVVSPLPPRLPGLVGGFGGVVRRCPLEPDGATGRWRLDGDRLMETVTERTQVIALCHPSSPTGARLTGEELEAVVAAAERHGCWILCDETLCGAELDGWLTSSIWGRHPRTAVVSGLSRAYGLPGLRVGWVVSQRRLIDDIWARHDYTTFAVSSLSDRIARVALSPKVRSQLIRRTRTLIRKNFGAFETWAKQQAERVSHLRPEAGPDVLLRYAAEIPSLELAERLLEEQGVLTVPGSCFGVEGHLRITFGVASEVLAAGLERLGALLATLDTQVA